jgi:carotenoid cleavage dioxygenase-like enzyme
MATETQTPDRTLAYASLEEELTVDDVQVDGELPGWLHGTLLRISPAKFEIGDGGVKHWFDGLAMLHRFSFASGRASYGNRFIRSRAYREAEQGRMSFAGYASDPCRSMFSRFAASFAGGLEQNDNTNVNLVKLGDDFIAMTETPMAFSFDPETLDTLELVDAAPGQWMTPHPHRGDEPGSMINYAAHFARKSEYRIYSLASASERPRIIASVPVSEPSYMHSFAVTERYAVLNEYPFVVSPLTLKLKRRPFIENFKWKPERGTNFIVVDRRSGELVGRFPTEPFFSFHVINAYEDGREIVMDLGTYPDPGIIDALYLEPLRNRTRPVPATQLRRYRIDLDSGAVTYEVLLDEFVELPTINYGRASGRDYRYAYVLSARRDNPDPAIRLDMLNQILKVDVKQRTAEVWREDGCYPGETVFVQAPDAVAEDDGIALSLVLDTARGTSFVLVLDGSSFTELARVHAPHHIPLGFHGRFFAS